MKIILLQDEKKLGKKGEIIETSEGYARNYILPKKIGVEATPKNLNDLKLQKANTEKIAQEQLLAAQELAKVLETKQVVIKVKAGEGGKMFGSVSSKEIAGKNFEVVIDYTESDAGLKLSSAEDAYVVDEILSSKPKTFEASFFLPKSVKDRAGVLIGNYNNTSAEQINVEIYSNGLPRLYYKTNKKAYTYVFTTDVRSDSNTHLAITIDGLTATLYLNGVAKETIALEADIADALSNYKIGADSRASGTPYFKGTIYSVSIFDDVRTNEEIELDMIAVPSDSEGLLFSKYFADSYEGVDNIFANNIYYDNEVWSCDLTLYSEDTVSGQVYVAVYEDKVLKNIVSYTAKSKLPVSVECDDGQTVKIFWWDSNLQPFSRMFEIEVK